MRRLFWCSQEQASVGPRFIGGPFAEGQAEVAKTQKSRAAARGPGRKVQEPERGPLHQ